VLERIADYLKFGAPHIWIPEPYRQRQVPGYDSLHRPELIVQTDLAARLDFRELFARQDEPDE
jgi:hypothetical protein